MIRIITDQGQYDVPGTAEDVDFEKALKVTRDGKVVGIFRRWNHWFEITEEKD